MRSFHHIAKLIREKRMARNPGLSQSELSHLLGYKNGQFISNVERGLCNIPLKMLKKVAQILDIAPDELKRVILKDHEQTLDNHLKESSSEGRVSKSEVRSISKGPEHSHHRESQRDSKKDAS